MVPFAGVAVELCGEASAGFRRDDGLDPGLCQRRADPVGFKRPAGEDLPARQHLDQRRRSAQVVGLPGVCTGAMNAHPVGIARVVAPGAHAVLVLDGAVRHGAKPLTFPENISLLHLPPCSPELNPVENIRACLGANKLAITAFNTKDDIVDACCTARNFFANDPKAIASITPREWAEVS